MELAFSICVDGLLDIWRCLVYLKAFFSSLWLDTDRRLFVTRFIISSWTIIILERRKSSDFSLLTLLCDLTFNYL